MLASKAPYSAPLGAPTSQTPTASYHPNASQKLATTPRNHDMIGFTSPTKSEFSDGQDELASVRWELPEISEKLARRLTPSGRAWDEKRVIEWLHSIKCGQYESVFKGSCLPPESVGCDTDGA